MYIINKKKWTVISAENGYQKVTVKGTDEFQQRIRNLIFPDSGTGRS